MSAKHPVLPDATRDLVRRIGDTLAKERAPAEVDVEALLTQLAPSPPGSIAQIASEIQKTARLWWWRSPQPRLVDLLGLRTTPGVLMTEQPSAAWLMLFHYDGRVREAALDRLPGPPTSPFLFAAIAFRLNDWAFQVRTAAERCARRLFPQTAPEIVAAAGLALLDREFHWSRWGDEAAALYETLDRDDVAAHILESFRRPANGPESRRFRYLLRFPRYEAAVQDLARTAANPAVRAIAFTALLNRRIEWPVGYTIQWTDKIYGEGRRVRKMEGHAFDHDIPPGALIEMGFADRSPMIRRLAADAFTANPTGPSDPAALLARMLEDRSPAIRMRADYMVRHGLVAATA
jgi:hypothetical protein